MKKKMREMHEEMHEGEMHEAMEMPTAKAFKLTYSDDPHKDRGKQMAKLAGFKGGKRPPDNLGFKSGKPQIAHD